MKRNSKIYAAFAAAACALFAFSAGIYAVSDSVHSPSAPAAVYTDEAADRAVLIDINTADAEELMSADGIGETAARRIIEYRTENGPYSDVRELANVPGISAARAERLGSVFCASQDGVTESDGNMTDAPVRESSVPEEDGIPAAQDTAADDVTDDLMIDINSADEDELCRLRGIGHATAAAIIELRNERGGFSDISELKDVSGIGDVKYSDICGHVFAGTGGSAENIPVRSAAEETSADAADDLININTASADELMSLNGVGKVTAENIIAYRNENGGFSSPEDIMNVNGIGKKKFERIRSFICV